MRSTRLRKFRKKYQPLIISFKIVLVLYMLLFSVSYVTSDTVAYFDANNVSTIMITAGTWDDEEDTEDDETDKEEQDETETIEEAEDMSTLAFVEQELSEPQTCPAAIEVEVTNKGDDPMLTDAFYEVYYIEDGDPERDGEKITLDKHEGVIEVLENGSTQTLVYKTSKPGFYRFVMYQDEEASEEERIWGEIIEVVCEEEQDDEAEEEKSNEESNDKENTENDTTESEKVVDEEPVTEENNDKNKKEVNTFDEEDQEDPESNKEKDAAATKEKDVETDEKKENNEVDE